MGISGNHTLRETANRLRYQMDTGQPVDQEELRQLLDRLADGRGPVDTMYPAGRQESIPQFGD